MNLKKVTDITTVFNDRKFNAKALAKTIIDNHLEKELLVFALDKDQLISNRAMWVLNHCSDIDFDRVKPFHDKLINHLKNKHIHSGVVRSILRIFQYHHVPKKHESFLLDRCFDYLKNPSEVITVRVFAMAIVFNISMPYPELLNELSIILNHMLETEESGALRSRAKYTLKMIAKINQNTKTI
jgi:hypothetical protein